MFVVISRFVLITDISVTPNYFCVINFASSGISPLPRAQTENLYFSVQHAIPGRFLIYSKTCFVC